MLEEDGLISIFDVVVLLSAVNCKLEESTWGLLLISVLIELTLGSLKVAITKLALGDA